MLHMSNITFYSFLEKQIFQNSYGIVLLICCSWTLPNVTGLSGDIVHTKNLHQSLKIDSCIWELRNLRKKNGELQSKGSSWLSGFIQVCKEKDENINSKNSESSTLIFFMLPVTYNPLFLDLLLH